MEKPFSPFPPVSPYKKGLSRARCGTGGTKGCGGGFKTKNEEAKIAKSNIYVLKNSTYIKLFVIPRMQHNFCATLN